MKIATKLVSAALVIAGIVHLVPLVGVLGAGTLAGLYGLDFSEPNLSILMRHRAVLFGLLGSVLVVAAFRRALQPAAVGMGLVSVVSFLLIAGSTGGYNEQVRGIVLGDLVALVALVLASVLLARRARGD